MSIRQNIKSIARRLSNVRFIGRPVRIMGAITRLPYYHERQHYFETQQLPGLLHALSDVNGRQQIMHQGMVESIPVALRALRRDQVDLRTSVQAEIGGLLHRIDELRVSHQSELADLRDELAPVSRVTSESAASVRNMLESVQYLLGRVEFVRRELMFEMRYGAKTTGAETAKDSGAIEPKVVNQSKLDQARASSLRINMGCGHVLLDGYMNIDRRALPGVDVVAELDNMPFMQGEIDEIFSSHVIEHFPQEQLMRQLFPYWFGLLKPGGKFAAVVPDAQGMIEAYGKGEFSFEQLRHVTFGAQDYDGDFHFAMFTPESLTRLLLEVGFEDVVVLVANRENGDCREFEISAKRPSP